MEFRKIEAAAILLYGSLTLILLFAFAALEGSTLGMALAAAACGCTYVFQAYQFQTEETDSFPALALWGAAIILSAASLLVTMTGA